MTVYLRSGFSLEEDEYKRISRLRDPEALDLAERLLVPLLPYSDRLPRIYPRIFSTPFAFYHEEFWEWIDELPAGDVSPAFFGIWPRGGGKSSGAEVATIELGASKFREYALYVRCTQDQADKSVSNINGLIESPEVSLYYPGMAKRAVGKYGRAKGWRRERLVTSSGFVVDALGLDKAVRGVKDIERRPDLIILDDIDELHDSPATTKKKVETITKSILPAGDPGNTIVVFIQNLIIEDGVLGSLISGEEKFLTDRVVSGPHKAIEDLVYELDEEGSPTVWEGTPTWPEGLGLEISSEVVKLIGISSFLTELQHEVGRTGGRYDHIDFRRVRYTELPDLVRIAVWCDPAVTSTDRSDSNAVVVGGVDAEGYLYLLYAWEKIASPEETLRTAILKAVEWGADKLGIETDQGGDVWKTAYRAVVQDLIDEEIVPISRIPRAIAQAKAGAGHGSKVHRNERVRADYERGKIVHLIGPHALLEKSLRRFPQKPLDLADAIYWVWFDLIGGSRTIKKASGDWRSSTSMGPKRKEGEDLHPTRSKDEISRLLSKE